MNDSRDLRKYKISYFIKHLLFWRTYEPSLELSLQPNFLFFTTMNQV